MAGRAWERHTVEEALLEFRSDEERGLSSQEAMRRQERFGKNILPEERGITLLGKALKQFTSPLVFILLVAGVVTLVLAEYVDATVIFIALLINVTVGVFQEERASRAFEKLNESQERFATVIRDGNKHLISAEELVPGDIVVIGGGQYVPADMRLGEAKDLLINEAALTGEWVAVPKSVEALPEKVPLAERRNMTWRGTLVAEGYGTGVVVATGARTQVGIIAKELGSVEEHITPLRQNIRSVARFLTHIIAGSLVLIFALGILRGESLGEMLLISIAIAVAAIPSGLPAAVTVVLALGMESILKRGGLVRNLLAAETLGATTIILTDKTGTLTEAKMKLASVHTLDSLRREHGEGKGKEMSEDERLALQAAALASDAYVEERPGGENAPQELVVHGRPIEQAIVHAGLEAGISVRGLSGEHRRFDYLQFESKRRFGASLNALPGSSMRRLYVTGAPETLFDNALHVYSHGRKLKLSIAIRRQFAEVQQTSSENGMRFIGVAFRDVVWKEIPEIGKGQRDEKLIKDNVFLGFLAFEDPVREDVPKAIREVQRAGAEVLMITGDNPETAWKVACDVGITCDRDQIKSGFDVEKCDDEELYTLLKCTKVFARALPSQKLRIARVLKNKKEIVAMTGDGVNDAPALRSANIGVAVGSGTEVAKEASDMVLLDNSFSIIVAAIEEGRRIIDNLKKIVAYLLSTSFSEIFVIGGALAAGAPLPLLPAQILWANIIEEGLMSFSFAFERKAPGIMRRNPRESSSRNIMTPDLKKLIVVVSTVTGALLIVLFFWLRTFELPLEEIRTVMFVALSLDAIFFSFSMKSFDRPLWKINPLSNGYLLLALSVSVSLLLAAVSLEPLRALLSLVPLTPLEIVLLVGVGLVNLLTIEAAKYVIFERRAGR